MTLIEAIQTGRRMRIPNHEHGWLSYAPDVFNANGERIECDLIAHCVCQGTNMHPVELELEQLLSRKWITEQTWDEFERATFSEIQSLTERLQAKTCQAD